MRYQSFKRYDPQFQNFITTTTVFCDCGHSIQYFGPPEIAEQMLSENGGAIAGNLSRCKECYGRLQALVEDNIREARARHV